MRRIVFARVGWMQYYGAKPGVIERPIGGGKNNEENIGAEHQNFEAVGDDFLCYVQIGRWDPKRANTKKEFNLKRLDPAAPENTTELTDVLVILVARHPIEGGQRVVGWYRNATCFAQMQRDNKKRQWGYNFKARIRDAVLLPLGVSRQTLVPHGEGGMGRSNIAYIYEEDGSPKVLPWLQEVLHFIDTYSGPNVLFPDVAFDPSIDERAAVPRRREYSERKLENSVVFASDEQSQRIMGAAYSDPYSILQKIVHEEAVSSIDIASFIFRYSILEALHELGDHSVRLIIQPPHGTSRQAVEQLKVANMAGWLKARQLPLKSAMQHSKVYILNLKNGGYYAIIGSANFTNAGFYSNREYGVLKFFETRAVLMDYEPLHWFETLWSKTEELQPDQYDDRLELDLTSLIEEQSESPSSDARNMALLPFQREAVHALREKYQATRGGLQGLLVLPTGAGKTKITSTFILSVVRENPQLRVLWLTHMSELLEQALEEVQGTFLQNGLPFHIQYLYTGEISEIPDYPGIFFCSVQKTAIAIHQFRKHPFDLIVIDEAHRAGDDTQQYEKVLTYLKPKSKSILGLTATPYRFGGNRESLTRFFGTADKLSFVYKRDFGELEGLGPLTDYKQLFSRVIDKSILTGFNMNSDDDDQIAILRRFKAAKYRRQVVEAIMNEQLGFSQAIVFAIDTKHANDIATEVNEQNGQAIAQAFHEGEIDLTAAVDPRFSGSLNDYYRARLVSDFRTGKFKILVGVLLLSEGIDFPKVDAIFLARPTFSTRLLVQMIGRGLRGPAVGGTETCKVYDFTNQKQMHLDWHEMLLNDGNEIAQDEAYLKEIESLKKLNSKII